MINCFHLISVEKGQAVHPYTNTENMIVSCVNSYASNRDVYDDMHYDTTSMMKDQCRADVNIKMLSIMKMKKIVNIFFSNALMLFDSVNNCWNYGSQTGQRDVWCVSLFKANSRLQYKVGLYLG